MYNNTTSTNKQCNTTNTNVIQHSIFVQVRVNQKLYDHIQSVRTKTGYIGKDSTLLRYILTTGASTMVWMHGEGFFTVNEKKLVKTLNGLSLDEKTVLLELLKKDIGV